MDFQAGEARLEDFSFWQQVRIFFVQTRWAEREDNVVRQYKLYKGRRVLIRELHYR